MVKNSKSTDLAKKLFGDQEPNVEIVVSTYFPTRIIKSITIKDLSKDYNNSVTLERKDAKYLYEQLAILYGEQVQPEVK